MHYLTRKEYLMSHPDTTRQSIHNRIKTGSLPTTVKKRYVEVIIIDDIEYEKIKHYLVDNVHGLPL